MKWFTKYDAAMLVGLVIGILTAFVVYAGEPEKVLTTTEKTISLRQLNPVTYEVVTIENNKTVKKIVTIRQTVGPSYEVREIK